MPGTLKFLQDNGFETYDHLFDESYDHMPNFEDRLNIIYDNIKNFSKERYLDPLTEQKIQHNYERFYNNDLVVAGIKNDLINPLLEWCNG